MQSCKHANMQVPMYTTTQVYTFVSIQVCNYALYTYASMKVCKHESMQVKVCKYADMQVRKYRGIQVCKYAIIEVCNYASILIHEHVQGKYNASLAAKGAFAHRLQHPTC